MKRKRSAARTAPGTDVLLKRLGKRCRELRTAKGLTQQEAATQAGIMSTYLQVLERGTGNPTVAVLGALSKTYGVTLAELFAGV